ncbi:hypothetical protein IMZ23_38895 [Nocardia seriolae]|nr:hypothetical protein IMZ23_38895 [Nocardia seriolae]
MQRLLRAADWDVEAVRDDVRDYVVERLGDPERCWPVTRPVLEEGRENRLACNGADEILETLAAYCQRINDSRH